MRFSLAKGMRMFLLLMSFSFVFGVFSSPKADAACSWTKYAYVNSSSGTDYGTGTCWGTSSGTAYKTIQAALDARNAHYSGTEITIYFKGNTNQTASNSPSTNDVYIRPQTLGASTSALLTIKGKNNIRVESFKFTGSGGVKVSSQNDYVLIENNTFDASTTGIEVTASGQVNIIDNNFNSGWVYAHDNTELVALDLNDFTGSASRTADGVKWHVVAQNLTGGFYFFSTDVTSTSGNVLYAKDVDGASIMDNTVDGAGTTATAFYLYRVDGSNLTNNKLSDVRYGIRMIGDRFTTYDHVNNNTISLVDSATVESVGLEIQLYGGVDEVLSNVISGGDYAIKLYPAVVDLIQYNTLASSVADLYAENSIVSQVLTNVMTSSGTNIHFVSSSFSEIAQNAAWSTVYGMLFESGKGDISSWRQEGSNGDPSGTAVVVQGDIHHNDFYKSNLALGLSNYTVDEIYSNQFREVEDGMYAYFAGVSSFRENMLKHDGALVTLDEGVYLYDTQIDNFKRNSIADFYYGLYEEKGSNIPSGFIRNAFSKGQFGIYLNGASITAPMRNNTFTSSQTALTVLASGTNGVSFTNNTLYGQNNAPISLSGAFASPSVLVNNIFSEFDPAHPVYVSDLASLSVLDSNLYGNMPGGVVFEDTVQTYDLAELQALGLETSGYEEATSTLVNPSAGDLHLLGSSLAVNSADPAYAPTMDMDGLLRPVCMVSDRGAYEVNGGGMIANADIDGDGLCGFQETAWGTEIGNTDTDADGLNDHEEIYVYGTGPTVSDTDSDGFSDGEEVTGASDPLDASSTPVLDTDSDGLSDDEESYYGTDPSSSDTDGDGLSDGDEVNVYYSDPLVGDTDGDGLSDGDEVSTYGSDPTSTDTDSDGLSDDEEVGGTYGYVTDPIDADTDGDSFTDFEEIFASSDPTDASSTPDTTDTDGDGLYDVIETAIGTDLSDTDTDNDGLSDGEEVLTYGTDPLVTDTDGDGLDDYEEVHSYGTDPADDDTDSDGLTDGEEILTYGTDANDRDTDGDTLVDGTEVDTYGTSPVLSDTDSDGLSDYDELFVTTTSATDEDSDDDGLTDGYEVSVYGTNPNSADTDGDTINDYDEVVVYGTDPNSADTDADGLSDTDEVFVYGTDPVLSDTDSDGLSDGDELGTYGSDPLLSDTDSDGLSDYDEVSVYGTDPSSTDMDGDGLSDYDEVVVYGTDPALSDTDGDTYSDSTELTLGSDPLDASDYPVITDTDGDGLLDTDETSGTYGYVTDPTDTDTDDDGLSDYDEIFVYSADPTSNDTDGDFFTDGYEVSEGSSLTSAGSMPTLNIRFVSYDDNYGYGSSGSWAYGVTPYTSYVSVDLNYSSSFWYGVHYNGYGAFGVQYDTSAFIGTVSVYTCGSGTSAFDPTTLGCSAIPSYSSSSSPDLETTEVSSSAELEAWSDLSAYYAFSDYRWFRTFVSSSDEYIGVRVRIGY